MDETAGISGFVANGSTGSGASSPGFNDRRGVINEGDGALKRRTHVLEEFPEPQLEAIVIQWDRFRPTVLVQLKRSPDEPVQFPGLRPQIPGNADLPRGGPSALDRPLLDFVDASTGRVYGREAFNADILFSQRAFSLLQPEPDLVMPIDQLWECRTEALNSIGVRDFEGTAHGRDLG
jgi:hypothetical protein